MSAAFYGPLQGLEISSESRMREIRMSGSASRRLHPPPVNDPEEDGRP